MKNKCSFYVMQRMHPKQPNSVPIGRSKDICLMCPSVGSRTHRLLECPAGEELRLPFAQVVPDYHDMGSHLAELSAINVRPLSDTYLHLHFLQPMAILPEHVLSTVHGRQVSDCPQRWFLSLLHMPPCFTYVDFTNNG